MMRRSYLGAAVAMVLAAPLAVVVGQLNDGRAVLPGSVKPIRKHREARSGGWRPLNRSRHWRRAASYRQARTISPFPDRPVR